MEFYLLGIAALGLVSGFMIGCIGVGGVIIVPILVQAGFPVYTAIAMAMAGYILTGIIGTWIYIRKGSLDSSLARFLCLGAMPAAVAGSIVARVTPSFVLELIIGLLTALSGIQTLLRGFQYSAQTNGQTLSKTRGFGLGSFTGFISSLTGTGGPVVLIPIMLWLEVPILTTVGLAQAIQLPIAVLATIGNAPSGVIDPTLSVALGGGLSIGAWFGARMAHYLDQRVLRGLVAVTLLGVGVLLLGKTIHAIL